MDNEQVEFLKKLEDYLIESNIHTSVVSQIIEFLAKNINSKKHINKEEIVTLLKLELEHQIKGYVKSFSLNPDNLPYVMLVCGINGVGKTSVIGKISNLLHEFGWSVVVAACDTFRAAAAEQLRIWTANKVNDFVFKEKDNETSTKIAVRALNLANKKDRDVVIIDTAGRLQNDQGLMEELLKMKQKLRELSYGAPHDVVLVVDANCGYNALSQVKMYNDLIGITGILVTKTDIAHRPGMILSICKTYNIPVFGISDGEGADTIKDLDPKQFAEAILKDINKIM